MSQLDGLVGEWKYGVEIKTQKKTASYFFIRGFCQYIDADGGAAGFGAGL